MRQDPNVVTGTFPINQHYASILCDTSADLSFVSVEFKNTLGLVSCKLDVPYPIELVNGKFVKANEVIKGCTLELVEQEFFLLSSYLLIWEALMSWSEWIGCRTTMKK